MKNLLRLFLITGFVAFGIVLVALGFVRDGKEFMAPVTMVLFVLTAILYLLPTGLAVYRDCNATIWIGLVNVVLGWTVFGWVIALGWAAKGKPREPAHPVAVPPHPAPGR